MARAWVAALAVTAFTTSREAGTATAAGLMGLHGRSTGDGPSLSGYQERLVRERGEVGIVIGMVAYVVNVGHSIRVTISGSNWPYFSANPNNGESLPIPPIGTHSVWPTWPDRTANVTANNTVFHGAGSVVNIPVMPLLLNDEERLSEDGLTAWKSRSERRARATER